MPEPIKISYLPAYIPKKFNYCQRCGAKLIIGEPVKIQEGFDRMTGKPLFYNAYTLTCPNYRDYVGTEEIDTHDRLIYRETFED